MQALLTYYYGDSSPITYLRNASMHSKYVLTTTSRIYYADIRNGESTVTSRTFYTRTYFANVASKCSISLVISTNYAHVANTRSQHSNRRLRRRISVQLSDSLLANLSNMLIPQVRRELVHPNLPRSSPMTSNFKKAGNLSSSSNHVPSR